MKKNVDRNRNVVKTEPSSVTLKVSAEQWRIAAAIAAVMTAGNPPEESPFTAEEVLQAALEEGLAAIKDDELGTTRLGDARRHETEEPIDGGMGDAAVRLAEVYRASRLPRPADRRINRPGELRVLEGGRTPEP